jgi:hypothetical protein
VVLGLATSGCSFIFVTQPPAQAEQASHPTADCSTSRAAPVVDGIITGYQVVRTIYATQAPDSAYQGAPISRGADIGLGLSFTALFLASTIYGAVNTSECRDFKARADEYERSEERKRSEQQRPPPRRAKPELDEDEDGPAVDEPATPAPPSAAPAPAGSTPPPAPSAVPPPAAPGTPPAAAPSPFTSVPKTNGAFPP